MATVKATVRATRNGTPKSDRSLGGRQRDSAQKKLDQLGEAASALHDQARAKAQQVNRTFSQFLQDQPIKSVLISASLGLLIGRFWRRR